jgi:hypothetical protein
MNFFLIFIIISPIIFYILTEGIAKKLIIKIAFNPYCNEKLSLFLLNTFGYTKKKSQITANNFNHDFDYENYYCGLVYLEHPNDLILDISNVFSLSVDAHFPNTIKYIKLGLANTKNFKNMIFPNNLKVFNIACYNDYIDTINFPNSTKLIVFGTDYSNIVTDRQEPKFPELLECIIFEDKFNFPINNLPDTIKTICFSTIESYVGNLPYDLKKIVIKNFIKKSLKKLKIPFGCNIYEGIYNSHELLNTKNYIN